MYACWRIKTNGHEFEDSNGNQIHTIHLRFWCPIANNLTWCIKGCEKCFNKNGAVSIVIFWIKLSSISFSLEIQHIEIWAKSFMFCRRCTKCILVRGNVYFDSNFTDGCLQGSNWWYLRRQQRFSARWRSGNKPFPPDKSYICILVLR